MPTMDTRTFYDFNAYYINKITDETVKIYSLNYYTDKVITESIVTGIKHEYDSNYFEDNFRKLGDGYNAPSVKRKEQLFDFLNFNEIQYLKTDTKQTWEDFCKLALKDGINAKYGQGGHTCLPSYTQKAWYDLCESVRKNLRGLDILDNITKIITKGPATIVFWKDGTKTVVKLAYSECHSYDLEKGLAMAILKKQLGDKYYNRMKKVIENTWEDHNNK